MKQKGFSVVSWNIQSEINITGYTKFSKIKPHLENLGADIICLQEAVNAKELFITNKLLSNYHILIPKQNLHKHSRGGNFNYNIILSKYPFVRSEEVAFPQLKESRPLEPVSCADIEIEGIVVRIYNCHFPIFRTSPGLRETMFMHLAKHARAHEGPTIICGDLNTTLPPAGFTRGIVNLWHQIPKLNKNYSSKDERYIFKQTIETQGFKEILPLGLPTWSPLKTKAVQLFHLKLDWFMIKGLRVLQYNVGPFVSDHTAIYAHLTFENRT